MILMCVIMTIESVQVHLDNDEDLVTLSEMYEQLKELGYILSYARCSSYRCWSKTNCHTCYFQNVEVLTLLEK